MFRLLLVVLTVVSCSIEEETSEFATADNVEGRTNIPIERADVNRDGEINVLDLTAVSYWMGETVADWFGSNKKVSVEREILSELKKNPEVEVGKFFSIFVTASLDGGTRLAGDFYTDGKKDPTCDITTEIVAQNAAGEVVTDAIASFNAYPSGGDDPDPTASVGQPAYVPSKNNRRGYNRSLLMFFTSSALRNNVVKLVIKSGSKCGGYYNHMTMKNRKKLTPLAEVAQIPVTIRDRSDDLTVTADWLANTGSLYLEFSRDWRDGKDYAGQSAEGMKNRTESKHMAIMLIDNLGVQRGYFSTERGVASKHRYLYPEIGTTTYGGVDTLGYTIHRFGPRTVGGRWGWNNNTRFACAEGWRVLVLIQDLHKVVRGGTIWVAKEGTTTIYEGACSSVSY